MADVYIIHRTVWIARKMLVLPKKDVIIDSWQYVEDKKTGNKIQNERTRIHDISLPDPLAE